MSVKVVVTRKGKQPQAMLKHKGKKDKGLTDSVDTTSEVEANRVIATYNSMTAAGFPQDLKQVLSKVRYPSEFYWWVGRRAVSQYLQLMGKKIREAGEIEVDYYEDD